jgi:PhnB protein
MKMHPYLNFDGDAEAAFRCYAKVLGGELSQIMRYSDLPPGAADLTEAQRKLVLHVGLQIPGGLQLMASDVVAGIGPNHVAGNNVHIMLNPDSRVEADRLMGELSADGGTITMPIEDQFWGDYHGQVTDRFGVHWMINVEAPRT